MIITGKKGTNTIRTNKYVSKVAPAKFPQLSLMSILTMLHEHGKQDIKIGYAYELSLIPESEDKLQNTKATSVHTL